MRTIEYTINEEGRIETICVIGIGISEKLEIVHIMDIKTKKKIPNVVIHYITTFFYNEDINFKRIYLN